MFYENSLEFSVDKKNIVVIGTSNSIIEFGWCSSFRNHSFNEYNIINLSLGGCTSLLVSYQLDKYFNLLNLADFIIVEPMVNDISYLPNKLIEKGILFDAIEYLYETLATLNTPSLTLLLPTEKRLQGYFHNQVYLKHIAEAKLAQVFIVDMYPYFKQYEELTFLDPGHIDLKVAWAIGKSILELVEYLLNRDLHSTFHKNGMAIKNSRYTFSSLTSLQDETTIERKNSRYFCKLSINSTHQIEIKENCKLVGVLHWCSVNDSVLLVKINGEEEFSLSLKSKYLRLSSPNKQIQLSKGDFINLHYDKKGGAISDIIFQKNVTVKKKVYRESELYNRENNFLHGKLTTSILSWIIESSKNKKSEVNTLFSLLSYKEHYLYARDALKKILNVN
jgi:hypothetical protein